MKVLNHLAQIKIAAVLFKPGIRISPQYTTEFMWKTGLQRVVFYSKWDYQRKEQLNKRQYILQIQFQVDVPNWVRISNATCSKTPR